MKLALEIYRRIPGRLTKQPLPRSSAALRTSSWADKLRRMALCRELLLIWSLLRSFHFHPLTDDSQPAARFFRGWIMVCRSYRSRLTSREAFKTSTFCVTASCTKTLKTVENMENCFAFFSGSLKTARQQTNKPNRTVEESNSKNLNGIFPYASTRTGVDEIISSPIWIQTVHPVTILWAAGQPNLPRRWLTSAQSDNATRGDLLARDTSHRPGPSWH